MKKIKATLTAICVCLIIPLGVSAKEINHFYADSGDTVALSDTVNASVALAGEKISASGKVNGVFFGAANEVSLSGETDYAAVAGNTVDVSGMVLKDAAIAGNVVKFKNATFQRDVAVAASNVKGSGTFNRDVVIASQIVELNDITVTGDLKLYASNITIGSNVTINGTLIYPEDAKANIDKGAVVGNVVKSDAIDVEASWIEIITEKVFSILSLVLIFVVLSLAMSKVFNKLDSKYEKFGFEKAIEVFTKGLVFIIAVPIIAILLMNIVIGIPLAFIVIALYVIAIYLSKIFAAYLIGSKIAGKWMKDTSILVKGLIGLAIIFVIGIIPYVSVFLAPIIVLVGLGVMIDAVRK